MAVGMERVTTTEVPAARALDVNRFRLPATEDTDDGASLSSPNNSAVSSFQMDFSIMNGNNGDAAARNYRREHERAEGADRGSDDEENGSTRKKLRLSKEQSAFLEESFKEHTTLNPVTNFQHHLFPLLFLILIKNMFEYEWESKTEWKIDASK